eukprot:SAG31_NODE_33367_length_344_cov_1.167347_1_plen_79_part_10
MQVSEQRGPILLNVLRAQFQQLLSEELPVDRGGAESGTPTSARSAAAVPMPTVPSRNHNFVGSLSLYIYIVSRRSCVHG